ncbi:MAG: S1-like domain-containing RNA-binding protein [Anaeroplasmataceae bacterium]
MIKEFMKNTLRVVRKSDLGYMLTDDHTEVLLHFREANDIALNPGDTIEVFIYLDKQGRLCATLNEPTVTLDKPGFATVVEVISNLGVFLSINCGKDILLSKDYLPYNKELWPDIDDKIFISLKINKNGVKAKPLNRFEIIDLNAKPNYAKDQGVEGYVIRTGEEGIGVITTDLAYIFIHKTHLRKSYRLGEYVTPKIIMIKKNEYNGSLTDNKEKMIDGDSEIILNYLKNHNGRMTLTAKSSSEEVEKTLKLSRKAFKRALGNLYREQKVICNDDETILK